MKIVMVIDFFGDKLDYQENIQTRYYIKHGHKVTVIASTIESIFDYYADRHDRTAPGRTYVHEGVKIVRLPYRCNILYRLRYFPDLKPILVGEAPDLIFVKDIMPNFPELIAYKRNNRNCKMVMDYHADYSNSGHGWLSLKILHGMLRKYYLDKARPHLERIFPVTPSSAAFLRDIYNVSDSEMELLPLGADTDLAMMVKQADSRVELRNALGIKQGDFVIFTGGKLNPLKRTEMLIGAVRALRHSHIHIVIVGEAEPAYANYEVQLRTLSAGLHVHFVGWKTRLDVLRYMVMADIAVFPSSQSILWQQAIGMGLPLIIGGMQNDDISYLNRRQNIVVIENEQFNTQSFASAIDRLATEPLTLASMSAGAARVADEYLDWNKLVARTLTLPPQQADINE